MSAPWLIGRSSAGVAIVLSQISGRSWLWARSATAADVEEAQARIARKLAVEESRVAVDLRRPLVDVGGVVDPAALDVAFFHQPDVELLERAAVALRGGDEVLRFEFVVRAVDQERLHGGHDRRHARRGRAATGLAVEAVALQQGQRPFVVIRRRIGDSRVAPRGNQVGQGGGHFVGVAVGLRRAHEDRLDDRALVILDRVLNGVQAMHRDRVELPLLDFLADVAVAGGQILLVLVDISLHSRRDVDWFAGGHEIPRVGYWKTPSFPRSHAPRGTH